MEKKDSYLNFLSTCLAAFLATAFLCQSQDIIPEIRITSLQKELSAEIKKHGSTTSKRRAWKNLARDADALLRSAPDAPNRFRVLSLKLESQKRLFSVDNSERNRDALFETCNELAKAPDEYAELRLEADLMLSEKNLSAKNADLKVRTQALEELIQRYRDTPAEAKCLMIASRIAPKLEAFDLVQSIKRNLFERFPGDHEVIEFRRKTFHGSKTDVLFQGTFTRPDGTTLSFPMDRMGHTYVLYFWSKETPDIEQRLAEVKNLQTQYPEQFEVFSFNLDELPDAGEKTLRTLGLDWTALHLPGGRQNPTFRVYAQINPSAVLVNAHGHALLVNGLTEGQIPLIPRLEAGTQKRLPHSTPHETLEQCIDSERYLAQLQSLFIGDFLVSSFPKTGMLKPIRSCFIAPPMRYRLSREEALANYTKAEQLCRETLVKHNDAPNIRLLHNYRIIALLGMWNLAAEPKHLETAVEVAKATLGTNPPAPARVVPQFCLAKDALRRGQTKPGAVLKTFTENNEANGEALAAAALLAQDGNQHELFATYRDKVLTEHGDAPNLWPVTTYLRDRHHGYRWFRATHSRFGFTRTERHSVARNIAALDEPADTTRLLEGEFTTLEGGKITLPQDTAGKYTFVTFLELPTDEESAKNHDTLIKKMTSMAEADPGKSIRVIAAFLSDDIEGIKALVQKNEWTCETVTVPGGLENPLVRRYGILSADRMPNIFLLRHDGSISWWLSGITWPVQGSSMTSRAINALDANISVCQMEAAKSALDKGEFDTAIKLFSEAFAPTSLKGDCWTTFRFHGRGRAHAALKNWEAALADIDTAIECHVAFSYGQPHRCELVAKLQLVRAEYLDKLGRIDEAEEERRKAAEPTSPHNKSPFGLYTDERREKFRLNPHQ